MYRRRFLSAIGLGTVGTLAGCSSGARTATPTDHPSPTDSPTPTPIETPTAGDISLPIPESDLTRGASKDAIPAITEPAFAEDWAGLSLTARTQFGQTIEVTPRLEDSDTVIGVERDGEARAYPLKILNWHEIVNDSLGGPLLITYCPLCGSGMTAIRTVDGQETVFGVSGYLFKNDLVMYDKQTESLWSQILATAINGPKTGERLELVPSTFTSWGAWREEHESTAVLLPPPESNTVVGPQATRNYSRNPYGAYDKSPRIGIGGDYDDERLHPKAMVIGIEHGGVARAYPFERVESAGVVNDEVGGLPVVIAVAPGDTLVGYDRLVDGDVLTFEVADDRHLSAGGSRWRTATGEAVDGPYEGTSLDQASDTTPLFFFAWKDFNPETTVYGED